jgi:sulfoxide reductase heme-binding subunit YedZ
MQDSFSTWLPWSDRAGRLSRLKLAFFVALMAPAVWMFAEWRLGLYSPRPLTDAIRESGDWALRVLVASLAVTPLRFVASWNRLILVRRALGLAALYYTLLHIVLWIMDLHYDWWTIARELVLRMFLTVGLIGTLIMVALGVTSNDWGIRKLGAKSWNRLHAFTYLATALSLLHFFMESKLDVSQAVLLAGLFLLAMAFRVARKQLTASFLPLAIAAVVCGVLTALIEALSYAVSTTVNVQRVLLANFDFSYQIRPAWWVFATGIVIALLSVFRAWTMPKPARGRVK